MFDKDFLEIQRKWAAGEDILIGDDSYSAEIPKVQSSATQNTAYSSEVATSSPAANTQQTHFVNYTTDATEPAPQQHEFNIGSVLNDAQPPQSDNLSSTQNIDSAHNIKPAPIPRYKNTTIKQQQEIEGIGGIKNENPAMREIETETIAATTQITNNIGSNYNYENDYENKLPQNNYNDNSNYPRQAENHDSTKQFYRVKKIRNQDAGIKPLYKLLIILVVPVILGVTAAMFLKPTDDSEEI